MARAKSSIGKTVVWIILGLLILGLAGFGATSFSGTQRSIGSVGDAEIGVDEYARALQNEIRAFEAQTRQALPFQQAQALGLPDRVLAQMVIGAALDNEAAQVGLSIGDMRLAQELQAISAFNGTDGSFDRTSYTFALRNAGITEAEFEENLRTDNARALLQSAIVAGIALPDSYIETLLDYAGERRAYTFAPMTGTSLLSEELPVPGDGDLRAWYDANIDVFTAPEAKLITYAWLTPEMIVDSVEIDETALRAAYDERESEFNMPERRLVERLVFADDASAAAALERLNTGEIAFEDLVIERGLSLSDTDMGDVTEFDLDDASEIVFAAGSGDVVGPAPTVLGPALFRVNAVLPEQSTTFEQAQPALRDELALDRARRVIEAQQQDVDDRLAAGATLEDLAAETDMQLGEIAFSGASDQDIAGYDAFREEAQAITVEDFPAVATLGDGGIFAMRMNELRPATPRPFDEVADEVRAGWERDQRLSALEGEAERMRAELSEGRTYQSVGLLPERETGLTRNATPTDQPPELLAAAFDMAPGDVRVLRAGDDVFLLRLDEVLPTDMDSEEAQSLSQTLSDQAAGDVANDLFRALATDIQARVGVRIDRTIINAVHANFP